MSISTGKAILGTLISAIVLMVLVPVGTYFAGTALDVTLGLRSLRTSMALTISSAACAALGVFWISWAYSYLLFVGKGLPIEVFGRALHPTRYLVTTGPYAYTRNPILLGVLFLIVATALFARSKAGLALAPLTAGVAILYLMLFEENALLRRFGDDYRRYRRCVPLLLPRLSSYVHEPTCDAPQQ
jgi:protein-S-isoprenylcysteine O-methyltransferase Ste14